MRDPDAPRDTEEDDWFVDLGDEPPTRAGGGTAVGAPDGDSSATDDWLHGDGSSESDGPREGLTVRLGTLIAAAVLLIVLILVIGLAIGGAFSSGGKKATTTTTPPTTAQTPTTTATTPVAPATVPPPAVALKPGDQGTQVKRLQRALKLLGYKVGKIDGDYGTSTQASVQAFQKASKLTADGVLGPKTLLVLKQALQTNG